MNKFFTSFLIAGAAAFLPFGSMAGVGGGTEITGDATQKSTGSLNLNMVVYPSVGDSVLTNMPHFKVYTVKGNETIRMPQLRSNDFKHSSGSYSQLKQDGNITMTVTTNSNLLEPASTQPEISLCLTNTYNSDTCSSSRKTGFKGMILAFEWEAAFADKSFKMQFEQGIRDEIRGDNYLLLRREGVNLLTDNDKLYVKPAVACKAQTAYNAWVSSDSDCADTFTKLVTTNSTSYSFSTKVKGASTDPYQNTAFFIIYPHKIRPGSAGSAATVKLNPGIYVGNYTLDLVMA